MRVEETGQKLKSEKTRDDAQKLSTKNAVQEFHLCVLHAVNVSLGLDNWETMKN
jgi:hypothetical protein